MSLKVLHDEIFQHLFPVREVGALFLEFGDLLAEVPLDERQVLSLLVQLLILQLQVVLLLNDADPLSLECLVALFVGMHLLALLHKAALEVVNRKHELSRLELRLFVLALVVLSLLLQVFYVLL